MKFLTLIILLTPVSLIAQDLGHISPDCWKEYKHENLPQPESEYCPLILCPDSSVVCYLKKENEIYSVSDSWYKISENRIQLGENGPIFNILLQTDSEMHLQSVEFADFKIYLRK